MALLSSAHMPTAPVPSSHTEDESRMVNLEFKLKSCPWPQEQEAILAWSAPKHLLPTTPLSHPEGLPWSCRWVSSRTVMALGCPNSTDTAWDPTGSVKSSPSPFSLQTILPPYFLFCRGLLKQDKKPGASTGCLALYFTWYFNPTCQTSLTHIFPGMT